MSQNLDYPFVCILTAIIFAVSPLNNFTSSDSINILMLDSSILLILHANSWCVFSGIYCSIKPWNLGLTSEEAFRVDYFWEAALKRNFRCCYLSRGSSFVVSPPQLLGKYFVGSRISSMAYWHLPKSLLFAMYMLCCSNLYSFFQVQSQKAICIQSLYLLHSYTLFWEYQ